MESLKISSKINLHTSSSRRQKIKLFSLINYYSKRLIKQGIATKEEVQKKLQPFREEPITTEKLLAQLNALKSYHTIYEFNWYGSNIDIIQTTTSGSHSNNWYVQPAVGVSSNAWSTFPVSVSS
jgi:hypothetical protein